tara:strand:- start:6661 stop:8427 length:1767 start_codon:yes stop_codon:yes gene_type:complete
MTRYPWILLLSLCLAPQVLAVEQNSAATEATERNAELSSDLDQFVRGAINEGFLTPIGSADSSPAQQNHSENLVEPTSGKMAPVKSEVVAANDGACTGPYALDFSELQTVGRYQDLYEVRDKVDAAAEHGDAPVQKTALAKAHIALGLYSEALMVLRRTPGPEFTPYRKLAELMNNRQRPDTAYFHKMDSCRSEAGHWLALAQFISGDAGGVQKLQDSLSGFRKLPLQLRIDYAALVIPELERIDEKGLARKLMADFSEDQVNRSPQLRFVDALVKLDSGDSAAERTVVGFLSHPQFQEQALAAMLRRKRPLDPAYQEILLSDLMRKFGQQGSDRQLAASLQFALEELSARSKYQPIMELAQMPALQNPAAQAEVKRQLVSSLKRDLSGEDRLRNLAAISAMASDSKLLDDHPSKDQLVKMATEQAVHFGFGSMASALVGKSETKGSASQEVATLAFRRHDYASVYALADEFTRDEGIAVLAAKSAIMEQNQPLLIKFENRMPLKPESLLALIEQDAVSGHWIVSDRIYAAADQLTGADHKQRVERVSALKRAALNLPSPTAPMTMARVREKLSATPPPAAPASRGSN